MFGLETLDCWMRARSSAIGSIFILGKVSNKRIYNIDAVQILESLWLILIFGGHDNCSSNGYIDWCIKCTWTYKFFPSLSNMLLWMSGLLWNLRWDTLENTLENTLHNVVFTLWRVFSTLSWLKAELLTCILLIVWQFVISDSDEWAKFITMWRRTTWQSFPHSQPTLLHIIVPSWQLTVSMHQIGSLICNQHDKLMIKMTVLFLVCIH